MRSDNKIKPQELLEWGTLIKHTNHKINCYSRVVDCDKPNDNGDFLVKHKCVANQFGQTINGKATQFCYGNTGNNNRRYCPEIVDRKYIDDQLARECLDANEKHRLLRGVLDRLEKFKKEREMYGPDSVD